MEITLKLYAGLGEYLPAHTRDNATLVDIETSDTVVDVISRYNVPEEMIHLVLLNGVYLHPEERVVANFKEGDSLAIWPAVAGG